MFCLRSWLPLLFIPTNASPLFILSFVILTYILHRPCIYCSALLLILFTSSCQWSDRCFFDLRGDWFSPRFSPASSLSASTYTNGSSSAWNNTAYNNNNNYNYTIVNDNLDINYNNESLATFIKEIINSTATALAGAAMEEVKRRATTFANGTAAIPNMGHQGQVEEEWTGIGLEWLRSLLGRREWTIPCIDVKVQL